MPPGINLNAVPDTLPEPFYEDGEIANRVHEIRSALMLVQFRGGICSQCGNYPHQGHTDDCRIGRALAQDAGVPFRRAG